MTQTTLTSLELEALVDKVFQRLGLLYRVEGLDFDSQKEAIRNISITLQRLLQELEVLPQEQALGYLVE